MTMVKKIVAAAAAAVSISVLSTTAFALTEPAEPVSGARNQVPGTYMYFEWSSGYAKVTNISRSNYYCTATVLVYDNLTGKEVDNIYRGGVCAHNESVTASTSKYTTADYNFLCLGGIHGGTSVSTPVIESESRKYPI